jgi:lycopene cyclase domain-containing protein
VNTHYTYYVILAASLAGPLALSFDKKVAYHTKWKYLFPAMIIPAVLYLIWDSYFTSIGVWQFNSKYVVGPSYFHLPVEEWLFFIVIPYCCIFIYECIRCYFPNLTNKKSAAIFLQALAVVCLIVGVLFYKKIYTSFTFLFLGAAIVLLYAFKKYFASFNATAFLISYAIILIPYLVVNGFLTALPVLIYNDAENLGIRIYTIPFEDAFYGMLLVLLNVVIYEKLKTK